jgi:ATPase family associated with various cellular activities (AAA)
MPITDQTTLTLTMRPRSFDDLLGLEEPIRVIKAKLDKNEIPRGILLKGPYGCGKTTLAHIIARYIQGPFFDGQPDVTEVNAANYRKIENMRQLADSAQAYPMVGTYRAIILDECHKLTGDSQDVLLKELEVPSSPTVWILATTDPEKLNSGVRDRCFQLEVKGMESGLRHDLIQRAAKVANYEGNLDAFEQAITKARITSPRKILMAFDELCQGKTIESAVGCHTLAITPEYNDIAFAVCFGRWASEAQIFGGTVTTKPVSLLLRELEDRLKKKPLPDADAEEGEVTIDDDDVADSKPEAARAIRAVVGAYLKNRLLPKLQKNKTYKYPGPADALRAAEAMSILANDIPGDSFELQWSGLITTLFKVNQRMQKG